MDLKAVGARIKKIREEKGMTQEDLAEKVDLYSSHISVIERGEKVAKLSTFIKIANALEVSSDTLLYDVVDYAILGEASDLSIRLSKQSPSQQRRILSILDMLLKEDA